MVKMTFTLDDQTVAKLRRTAERHNRPQSWVVREAVADYAAKSDMLTPEEQARRLEALERFKRTPITGTSADVDREIAQVRASRRASSLKRTPR
jgi:predicted transcriptional regulator